MEEISDEWAVYFNKVSGKFVDISSQYASIAEDIGEDEDIPEHYKGWEKELIQSAIEIECNWCDYVKLPNKYNAYCQLAKRWCEENEIEYIIKTE